MSIAVGQKIPSVKLKYASEKGPADITTDEIFAGKKVVLFAVPGAFTPTCSNAHLPGFVVNVDAIKAKGVDTVVCMSVNDAFVMGAWGKSQNAEHLSDAGGWQRGPDARAGSWSWMARVLVWVRAASVLP
jgi:peroxiredoxin